MGGRIGGVLYGVVIGILVTFVLFGVIALLGALAKHFGS